MQNSIPVIDLFAGPGGLGEGFTSVRANTDAPAFRIAVSIENEQSAHQTLKLRAFYRHLRHFGTLETYYDFLKGNLGKSPEDELYRLPELRDALCSAEREARRLTLGKHHADIYKAIRETVGKRDCVLIGGPPCQAYSLVGRSRNYGDKSKKYVASEDHRNFLYIEYLRIVSRFQPLVFVMENVKGILSAKVGGQRIFDTIRRDLQDPCKAVSTGPEKGRTKHRYRLFSFVAECDLFGDNDLPPSDFLIRSELFGIPQARHRVIFLGVREDLIGNFPPRTLARKSYEIGVKSVIGDLPRVRSRVSKEVDTPALWLSAIRAFPRAALRDGVGRDLRMHIDNTLRDLCQPRAGNGTEFGLQRNENKKLDGSLTDWYIDSRLSGRVVNHVARGHKRQDLHRYLFCAAFASLYGESPKSTDFPEALWPDHKNFNSGHFSDRFRVQQANKPGSTVTSHISKDGHYYIHDDPTQCRSLTVREAARIQTFPDNYFFAGNRTQQYAQVGNAVPPYLARQLAEIVYDTLLR